MEFQVDGKRVVDGPSVETLEEALSAFALKKKGSLGLRKSSSDYISARREGPGGFSLHLYTAGCLSGALLPDYFIGDARAMFQDYLRGLKPMFPWKKLDIPVTGGGVDDDCPLCQAMDGKL